MIRHTGEDIVRNASPLRGVSACLADSDLISPMHGVDEGYLSIREQPSKKSRPVRSSKIAFYELDIWKACQLLNDQAFSVPDLSANMPANG